MRKLLIFFGVVIVGLFAYHFDAIHGQWKFNQLCQMEAGSRVYVTIERNVGWLVDEDPLEYLYKSPFEFKDVAFVRWRNKKGEWFDVRMKTVPGQQEPIYEFSAVEPAKMVRYKYRYTSVRMEDDERFSRTRHEVIEVNSGKLVASHTDFNFQWTKPERMLLNMPTGSSCELKQDTF